MRFPKLRIAWSVVCGVVAMLIAGCGPSDATINRLKSGMAPAIQQLEAYCIAHGEYPGDLAKVGIVLPNTSHGKWEYRTDASNSTFSMTIQDTGAAYFQLNWSSSTKEWTLDR